MDSTPASNLGNLVDLEQGEVLLPNYLVRRTNGIAVDLALFPLEGGFNAFVARLFAEHGRWVGANYPLMSDLLFNHMSVFEHYGNSACIKLADDVTVFLPNRQALYKGIKLDATKRQAEYFFEPVEMEVEVEESVYGEPDENGFPTIIGSETNFHRVPTKLNLDEFVADLWTKGIRYGIAFNEVVGVIARGDTVRMVVAQQLEPTDGSEAEIEEANPALHRDNSPKILPNGKADLRKFQNRFPQIALGVRLLKKVPRVLGVAGFTLGGERIEPELPADVDLQILAGPGTKVETQEGIEYVVSTRNGFLALDLEQNYIEVTEKIENKAGVSVKTTGDLSLTGDEFIEHGEVQEGRSVEGKNMTFRADVYGDILSQGGFVLLEGNLSNGSAKSVGGNVTSTGRIFNSIIEAWDGQVTLKYVERSLILGRSVKVEHAVNCEIIADLVQVDTVEGCAIAGKGVAIQHADTCRDKETVVSIVLLDLTTLEDKIQHVQQSMRDCKKMIAHKNAGLADLRSNVDAAKYLDLLARIQNGSIKLNPAQEENWHKMSVRFASVKAVAEKLLLDIQLQQKRWDKFQHELKFLLSTRQESGQGVQCEIAEVTGDTMVQTLTTYAGIDEFQALNAPALRQRLRQPGRLAERLFSDDEGHFSWKFELADFSLLD